MGADASGSPSQGQVLCVGKANLLLFLNWPYRSYPYYSAFMSPITYECLEATYTFTQSIW